MAADLTRLAGLLASGQQARRIESASARPRRLSYEAELMITQLFTIYRSAQRYRDRQRLLIGCSRTAQPHDAKTQDAALTPMRSVRGRLAPRTLADVGLLDGGQVFVCRDFVQCSLGR